MADELAQLFPELANLFDSGQPTGPDPMQQVADHGGVTDSDLEAFFAANPSIRSLPGLPPPNGAQATGPMFGAGQGSRPPVGGVEDGSTFTPSPTSTSPALPGVPTHTDAGIQQGATQPPQTVPSQVPAPPVPEDAEIAQLRAIGAALKNDPELRSLFAARMGGQVAPPMSPPAPPTQQQHITQPFQSPPSAPVLPPQQQTVFTPPPPAPPELDLEDPNIKALYDLVQGTQAELHQQRTALDQTREANRIQGEQQAQAVYRSAADGFAKRYELEESDLDHLSGVAARLGVLNSLASGYDPLTGLPVTQDPIAAVDRSLEIAYFTDPTYRQKEWERQAKQRRTDLQRKQRLAGVQGSSASAPRTQPAPTTQDGMRRELLGEVRQMMSGEWSEPVSN